MGINEYNNSWQDFEKYIEKKTKDRCIITNKNWGKLRDFHFENFIKEVPHPFGLIFRMIYMSKVHKNIPCIYRMYYKYRKLKKKELESAFRPKSRASAYRKYR